MRHVTPQHTATHCNTLQHTATHLNRNVSAKLEERRALLRERERAQQFDGARAVSSPQVVIRMCHTYTHVMSCDYDDVTRSDAM